ncbi:hypothetical protein SO802_023697 [Lithocarpus litseifolius]|uniref:Endonuclease/exonuclease/phosphatase domain-containing protein n=1 Tax=Lithocarpus litseifolius TaxID=425828 RepID=A0AAW2CAT6_9ROSI
MASLDEMWARFSLSEEEERGAEVSRQKELAVHRTTDAEAALLLDYSFTTFWMQIHNIPPNLVTQETGESIGTRLGSVLQVADPEDDVTGGEFLRVRIKIDISRPLPRCCKLWNEGSGFKQQRECRRGKEVVVSKPVAPILKETGRGSTSESESMATSNYRAHLGEQSVRLEKNIVNLSIEEDKDHQDSGEKHSAKGTQVVCDVLPSSLGDNSVTSKSTSQPTRGWKRLVREVGNFMQGPKVGYGTGLEGLKNDFGKREDEVVALVTTKDPKLVFLMETKVDIPVLERVGRRTHFTNLFCVPRVNSGGGLALFWKSDLVVDVQSSSNCRIDAFINHRVDDAWHFTSLYGDPDTASREHSWSLLRDLSCRSALPWVCMEDFNEILFADEKLGWLDRPERQMQSFRDALDYCRLKDLGFNGYPFTWCNRRPSDQNTWIRLDRGVATIDWILRFPTTRIHHLDVFHSDHKPLLLCLDSEYRRFYRKGKPFRFEAIWLKDHSCESVIKDAWGEQVVSESVWGFQQKIVACQCNLKVWDKNCFGHVRNSLQKKLKELQVAEEGGSYRTNPRRIYKLREEI